MPCFVSFLSYSVSSLLVNEFGRKEKSIYIHKYISVVYSRGDSNNLSLLIIQYLDFALFKSKSRCGCNHKMTSSSSVMDLKVFKSVGPRNSFLIIWTNSRNHVTKKLKGGNLFQKANVSNINITKWYGFVLSRDKRKAIYIIITLLFLIFSLSLHK